MGGCRGLTGQVVPCKTKPDWALEANGYQKHPTRHGIGDEIVKCENLRVEIEVKPHSVTGIIHPI